MRHPGLSATLAMALFAGTAIGQTRQEFCGRAPPPGFDQAPNVPHTGRYVNSTYGYSVRIPAPLVAFTRPSGPERGFGIVLSWTPRAFLLVDASYDVFYDITAAGVHRSDLNAIRVHDTLIADEPGPGTLDGAPGGQFRFQLRCGADPARLLVENILVVRRREVYRLQLQTTPERYQQDHRALEQMARSWRWLRPR